MRLMTYIEYTLIVVGVIGHLAGRFFGLPDAVHLGMGVAGAGLALAGIESLYTRRMSMRFSPDAAPNYAGFPALVWGVMALAAGVAVIASAYVLDAGKWARVAAVLHTHYGLIYLAAGILLAGSSVLAFVDPGGRLHWWEDLVYRLPRVALGTIFAVFGVVAVAAGAWQLFDAQGFAAVERDVLTQAGIVLRVVGLPDPFGAPRQ
jgi:hypothetical protein